MKKILLLAMILLIPSFVWAASSVTFTWDANTEPDLAGYRLYQAASSGVYIYDAAHVVLTIPVGTTTGSIQSQDGTWFWVLTAYDTSGNESEPSNEVTESLDSIAPDAPTGAKVTIIIKVE